MDIKEIQQKVELFGNVWKCFFLIVGDQHCLRSTFVCLKLWRPILCEATKPKDEAVFDTCFDKAKFRIGKLKSEYVCFS